MTTEWLKAAGIRALKTFAQSAVALIGASALITEVDWTLIASGAALAAILSLLTSIAGLPEINKVTSLYEPYTAESGDPMVRVTTTGPNGTTEEPFNA